MNLADAFAAELDALINPSNAFALGRRAYSRPELAARISGAPRGSKAYKAALRNLERYEATAGKQQRKPSERAKQQLASVLKQDDQAIHKAAPSLSVQVSGKIKISEDERYRSVAIELDREAAGDVLTGIGQGDYAGAYQTLWSSYGVIPDSVSNETVTIR
jgi:hypothetical protein